MLLFTNKITINMNSKIESIRVDDYCEITLFFETLKVGNEYVCNGFYQLEGIKRYKDIFVP